MGGLISGIGSLFGGNSAKTDRKLQLQGMTRLSNVFNFALPSAESATGSAQSYYQNLLSGNRVAVSQAAAPGVNAALSQRDALKRQLATRGTSRGGGTAGTSQQADTDTMAKIDNLLFGTRNAAAGPLASMGERQLSTAAEATGEQARIAEGSRATSQQLHNDAWNTASNLINDALGFAINPSGFLKSSASTSA